MPARADAHPPLAPNPAPPARAGVGRKLLLSLGVALLTLVLGELAARVYVLGPAAAFDREELRYLVTPSKAGLYRASELRDVLFEWKPGLRTRSQLAAFETNSLGLRDREYPLEKAPGIFRVAAVGDSFTVGFGVEEPESWPGALERRLAAREDLPPVEVWNWGVSAYHLEQYVATVERRVLATDPDLVVVGFCAANDHDPLPRDQVVFPYPVRPVEDGFYRCYLARVLKSWLRGPEVLTPRERPLDAEQRAYVERELARLGELARAADVPVVLLYLNLYPLEHGAVRAAAEAAGLVFVDATGPLRYEELARHCYLPIDHHPNAAAHALFAEELEAALEERALLPR